MNSPEPRTKIARRLPGVSNGDRANAIAETMQRGTVSAGNCPKSCPAIRYAAMSPSPQPKGKAAITAAAVTAHECIRIVALHSRQFCASILIEKEES